MSIPTTIRIRQKLCLAAVVMLPTLMACIKVHAQSVCLPSPRLLNVFPMGAQAGTQVEVTISGENLDELEGLIFSNPNITATQALDEQQQPIPNRFRVTVPADTTPGLVEAYAIARLGVSSSRVFTVGTLPEWTQASPSPSVKEAQPLQVGTTTNAQMVSRGMNYYRFSASAGQVLRIDCLGRGIDSKLDPVVVLTHSTGRVLATDRLASGIDYRVEQDGEYFIKVHDLTFQGGPEYFYRLSVQAVSDGATPEQFASTRQVGQYSWPPHAYDSSRCLPELEPNDTQSAQKIELPCQHQGAFYPAADVDCYEFQATKGQQWWIEIASHRLGAATGPAALVQRAVQSDVGIAWQDLLELKDISSPIRVSSNNYAYDGPPYNGGSTDLIGLLEIPEDGRYRLLINDLFGGTRDNPNSVYQLVIRPATADFALTGWVKHIELRNGDRNALSKPLALRPGATIALEIGAFRRDGFNQPIRLEVSGLPEGVSAATIDIPAGQTSGSVLLTAETQAPKGLSFISITGSAEHEGQTLTRICQIASMAWPIRDHWQEFPRPRLAQVVPLSVTAGEASTISIEAAGESPHPFYFKAVAQSKISVPMRIERRCGFSGSVVALSTLGNGFQGNPRIEIPLQENQAEIQLDLAKLNVAPGLYTIAFFGPTVAQYRDYPAAVDRAEATRQNAASRVEQLRQQLQSLKDSVRSSDPQADAQLSSDQRSGAPSGTPTAAVERELKEAEAALLAAEEQWKAASARSQPQDIADIVVTRPFTLEVVPAEEKP